MSTSTEKDLLDDGKDKEGTPNLSKYLSNFEIESQNEEDEPNHENDITLSPKITHSEEDIAFTEAFINIDLDDLDKFEAGLSSCLGDLFCVSRESEVHAIYIKEKDYEFNVNPKKIERVEATKFYGR
jgi:hypothetical protein